MSASVSASRRTKGRTAEHLGPHDDRPLRPSLVREPDGRTGRRDRRLPREGEGIHFWCPELVAENFEIFTACGPEGQVVSTDRLDRSTSATEFDWVVCAREEDSIEDLASYDPPGRDPIPLYASRSNSTHQLSLSKADPTTHTPLARSTSRSISPGPYKWTYRLNITVPRHSSTSPTRMS